MFSVRTGGVHYRPKIGPDVMHEVHEAFQSAANGPRNKRVPR